MTQPVSHPFVARVARAKLAWSAVDPEELRRIGVEIAEAPPPLVVPEACPPILERVFKADALKSLLGFRSAVAELPQGEPVSELLWLALLAVLRPCSHVGTAQWQYLLPNKTKARVAEPAQAFRGMVEVMAGDIEVMASDAETHDAQLFEADARAGVDELHDWANLVVTSPPYPNNYDYADATRLEMTFLGEIESWGDLQEHVRRFLLRSCSQHMGGADADQLLSRESLAPIVDELRPVFGRWTS